MAEALQKMGATVDEQPETLTIEGDTSTLSGATLDGRADHRIIMSLAIAGLVADGETTVTGAEHVDVSYPSFFDQLEALGATLSR
jgi:3-phosphoshikimate 1-carboxyvinyltransferase